MQQQFTNAFWRWNFETGLFVRLNVGIVKKGFPVFDARKCIVDVRLASANGFDLAAFELNAGFIALENVIIAEGLAVNDRLGRHIADWLEPLLDELRAVG